MIVGVMGPSGAGKDTLADRLVEKFNFMKLSFADPLKRVCKEIYDFSDTQLWGPSEERNKPDLRYAIPGKGHLSPRVALQMLGTEWGRACYPNTWVDYALRVADKVLVEGYRYSQKDGLEEVSFPWWFANKPSGVVIPDVRFKNELDCIHAKGGTVIRLRRKGADGDVGLKGHASEEEQKSIKDHEVDFVLQVPEGFNNYYAEIDLLMQKVPKVSLRSVR